MDYPVNQVITVNLKKFDGTGMTMSTNPSGTVIPNSLNYVLILNLRGIDEEVLEL